MCRLFGCRTAAPGGVAHEILHGANALRVQSREHPDGWGLGWHVGRVPQVVRSLSPAHGDEDFEEVSSYVSASTILAHIRKASVGRVALENTHPFEWGPWLFAHNGTVPRWSQCRAAVEAEIDPPLRLKLRGETDSERCFLLFLTRLSRQVVRRGGRWLRAPSSAWTQTFASAVARSSASSSSRARPPWAISAARRSRGPVDSSAISRRSAGSTRPARSAHSHSVAAG